MTSGRSLAGFADSHPIKEINQELSTRSRGAGHRSTDRAGAHDCDETHATGRFRRTDRAGAHDCDETHATGRFRSTDRAGAHDCDETHAGAAAPLPSRS
jgi:hypothetical protein